MIYFDNAATSFPYPEALDTYVKAVKEYPGNPASENGLGLKADQILEKARNQISRTLGLKDAFDLVFTSGATESNNDAILGYAYRHRKEGNRLVTTSVEHPSVLNVFKKMEKEGFDVVYLSVDREGKISLDELKEAVNDKTTLVSVMGVNNEVGMVYPLKEISEIVHAHKKAKLMSDLTQAIGKEEVDYSSLDLFTMSGHKVGGLKSSGLLGVRKGVLLDPLMIGGGQEYGERPGTVNVPLACSLATALRIHLSSFRQRRENAEKINAYLRKEIAKRDDAVIVSDETCTPFILNFALKKTKASVLEEALSNKGIYVSTRSACSSHAKGGSTVLEAMGYEERLAANAIRLSFSGYETIEDCEVFVKELNADLDRLRQLD